GYRFMGVGEARLPVVPEVDPDAVEVGGVRLEPRMRRVLFGNTEHFLTITSFNIMSALMKRPGRTVSSTELLRQVVSDTDVAIALVHAHVFRLRRKFGEAYSDCLSAVPGGYRFIGIAEERVSIAEDPHPTALVEAVDEASNSTLLSVGGIELDTKVRHALVGGRHIRLGKVEAHVLQVLIERAGEVVPYSEIGREVSGEGQLNPRTVPGAVVELRRKLGDAGIDCITTVPEIGYRFIGVEGNRVLPSSRSGRYGKLNMAESGGTGTFGIDIGGIRLEAAARQVLIGEREYFVPERQFKALRVLMENAGKVVSYAEIGKTIWGKAEAGQKSIRALMREIKIKFGDSDDKWLTIVPDIGFRFMGIGDDRLPVVPDFDTDAIEVGGVRLEIAPRRVLIGNSEYFLAAKQFDILKYLMDRAGEVVSPRELRQSIWEDNELSPQVEKSAVILLRRRLGPHARCLEHIPNRGYRFVGFGPIP
ncbi:winged helix-turn-helix domain-containing protein, partial [Nocardia sp. NPDC056564]